ncbi:hypothetical protein PG985_005180 [Apiospora marii]|uniref:Uncharacterized protein n=1 Tax=Apiospora marii TaxID=335849 RepID=A0ABR1SB95_9PEZI
MKLLGSGLISPNGDGKHINDGSLGLITTLGTRLRRSLKRLGVDSYAGKLIRDQHLELCIHRGGLFGQQIAHFRTAPSRNLIRVPPQPLLAQPVAVVLSGGPEDLLEVVLAGREPALPLLLELARQFLAGADVGGHLRELGQGRGYGRHAAIRIGPPHVVGFA